MPRRMKTLRTNISRLLWQRRNCTSNTFRVAEEICEELKLSHEAVNHPDMNALMFNVRILTILARTAHLEGRLNDALMYWESCLES